MSIKSTASILNPMGSKIDIEERPGFHRAIIPADGEHEGNIEAHLAAGWSIVQDPYRKVNKADIKENQTGSVIRLTMNKRKDASWFTGIVMELPIELYEKAQAEQQAEVDQRLKALDPDGLTKIWYGGVPHGPSINEKNGE